MVVVVVVPVLVVARLAPVPPAAGGRDGQAKEDRAAGGRSKRFRVHRPRQLHEANRRPLGVARGAQPPRFMTQPYPHTPNDPGQPQPPPVHEPHPQRIHEPIPVEPIHPDLPGPATPSPEPAVQPLPHLTPLSVLARARGIGRSGEGTRRVGAPCRPRRGGGYPRRALGPFDLLEDGAEPIERAPRGAHGERLRRLVG